MAKVTLDGPTTGYVRKVKIGNEDYFFSARVEYESNLTVKDPVTGAPVQVPEKGTSKTTQLYSPEPNVWVTSAELGQDGKWIPLKKSESKDLLGNSYYPSSQGDEYVLGSNAIKGLNSSGPNTLNNISVNDGKVLYKKYTGLSDQQVNSEFDVSSNVAPPGRPVTPGLFGPPTDPTEPREDSNKPPAVDTTVDISTITQIDSEKENPVFTNAFGVGDLIYPTSIRTNGQDFIKFTFIKYAPRKFDTSGTIGSFGNRFEKSNDGKTGGKIIKGSVILPIQPSISDSNNVDWNGTGVNPLEMEMTSAGLNLMSGSGSDYVNTLINQRLPAALNNENIKTAIKLHFAQKAAGVDGLLSRVTGAVVNPNLELLFQGPTLRPFNFTFRLSPRDVDEAKTVRQIIRAFKQYSAVGNSTGGLFLTTPNIFDIQYVRKGKSETDHKSLNRIKTCALKSVNVDYTPDGSYMTFDDDARTMTSYSLSLQFQELEPVTTSDYIDKVPYDEIGY
jgi:hypothetical protein